MGTGVVTTPPGFPDGIHHLYSLPFLAEFGQASQRDLNYAGEGTSLVRVINFLTGTSG